MIGRTIALYGDTGSGKTTQIGQLAKDLFKRTGKKTLYHSADLGGHASINPLVKLGVVIPNAFDPEHDDPWIWLDDIASGAKVTPEIGMVAGDSATSIDEAIMSAITKADYKIGQQNTQKFVVSRGDRNLVVGLNNESHYGLVQTFTLDMIWKSTWLTKKGVDVLWAFGLDRSEKLDSTPVIGPKIAGHVLTAQIPKWFNFCFRLVSIPVPGEPARHLLYLQEQPDLNGAGMSFGNPRYPLEASTPLPAVIEPASLVEAFDLIERGQQEAEEALRVELGL